MTVVRPRDLSPERQKEIFHYLTEQWDRAKQGRAQQVDEHLERWDKMYRAIPAEAQRNFPWPKASNLVVPIIRMHLDTFVSRTLGIVFGTQPLVKAVGFPKEHSDSLEKYLNDKCLYSWEIYSVAREWLFAGNKTGTATLKVPWVDYTAIDVMPGTSEDAEDYRENEVSVYSGPRPEVVPFEDFFVYPITATRAHHIQIKFHRLRFTSEQVQKNIANGTWLHAWEPTIAEDGTVTDGLKNYLTRPVDMKRDTEQSDAGVQDYLLYEFQPIEAHFQYDLGDDKYVDLVALFHPEMRDVLDIYFNPYPRNCEIFHYYRPFPRDGLFYGESLCQILGPFQEEISAIHNDRRNNSYLSNAPTFVRKRGADVPNPSTGWYPGKVFDLEDTDDLQQLNIGRAHDPMIDQESFSMQLSERLTGIGALAQGSAQGAMGKRGVYNTGGTMAMIQEGNERQHTNIRDFREVLSDAIKTCFVLQKTFGPDDPVIAFYPESVQKGIKSALQYATEDRTHLCRFEIRTSSAAMNKEVDRQNLMQVAGVLNNLYGQTMQAAQQLLNPQLNPGLRMVMNDIVKAQSEMAKRLLTSFDELDPEGLIPNVGAAIDTVIPGGSQGTRPPEQPPLQLGGTPAIPGPPPGSGLEGLQEIPGLSEGGH